MQIFNRFERMAQLYLWPSRHRNRESDGEENSLKEVPFADEATTKLLDVIQQLWRLKIWIISSFQYGVCNMTNQGSQKAPWQWWWRRPTGCAPAQCTPSPISPASKGKLQLFHRSSEKWTILIVSFILQLFHNYFTSRTKLRIERTTSKKTCWKKIWNRSKTKKKSVCAISD